MRKLIVAEHISLDGVIQSPGAPQEDPSNGFRLGGWTVPYDDDAIGEEVMDMMAEPFDLLLGRRTYDIWAGYWPNVKPDAPPAEIAELFNRVAKHVATHRPGTLRWKNSHGLEGDLASAVRALKGGKGANLLTWGSGEMVSQLLEAGLVDELRLIVYPVILGAGKRLYGERSQPSAFKLSNSVTGASGVVVNRYARSGDVRTGSFMRPEQ